jgi:GT2 family glycosyltransferase
LADPQNAEQQKQPPRVSVVVVSRNRAGELRLCLESLEKSSARETLQIIVVDNGSTDGSAQLEPEFPNIQFVRLPKNFGLTKALNIGWRAADAPYVFFLHDDTEVEPSAVSLLADTLDATPEAAAACPLLITPDGSPAPQLGSFPPNVYWRPAQPSTAPVAVDYPRGAALMMRIIRIKAIRQIDEHYGQFGADADLAMQIRKASQKIFLVPAARVKHQGRQAYTAAEQADLLLAQAVFQDKYYGFSGGLRARLTAIFQPLFSFRFSILRNTLSSQKIDGTQE